MSKYLVLICLFCVNYLFAQNYFFDQYSIQKGLSQSKVKSIAFDSAGFAWLGTEVGISKFDGKHFQNYTGINGLAEGAISSIYMFTNGKMLLGHESGRITFFNGISFKQLAIGDKKLKGRIFDIKSDRKGNLWFATEKVGLIQTTFNQDQETLSIIDIQNLEKGLDDLVFDIALDSAGNFYLSTFKGVLFFNPVEKASKNVTIEQLSGYPVTSCFVDSKNFLWVGTQGGGALKKEISTGKIEYYGTIEGLNSNFINRFFEDSKQNIWISTWMGGVAKIDENNKIQTFYNFNGLQSNKLFCINEDKFGNIWLGSADAGVLIYKGELFTNFQPKDGLIDEQIWSIYPDKQGNLWLGTNNGISIYNIESKTVKNIARPTLNALQVMSITGNNNGKIFAGSYGELVVLDLKGKFIESYDRFSGLHNDQINFVKIDDKNPDKLWLNLIGGFCEYQITDRKLQTTNKIGDRIDPVVSSMAQKDNTIIFGTRGDGVLLVDASGMNFLRYEAGLTNLTVSSVSVDKTGKIWVATEGEGLFILDGKKFKKFESNGKLHSQFITAIYTDSKNNLWIGSNKGISKFDQKTNSIKNYSYSDGFTGVEVKLNAIAEDAAGNIWIGSVKGLFKLNQQLENNEKSIFKPILTSFKIFLHDTVIQENISLPHYLNHINFSFTAIDYRNPDAIQYRYILHGLTKIWSQAKAENGVEFSKLNPGKYKLEVIAINADGEESEPLIYNFSIRPPFYKTWWFLILVNISVIAAIYFFIKWRISQLEKTKRILEQMVKERTAELQKEKNKVEEQNKLIEEKNKDITDSIVYAKRIQEAVLPGKIILNKFLPDSFVMYYPRDIVSGDFYWFNQVNDKFICIVADATGHGVPGAFMSMIGNTAFNEIINEKKITAANEILNNLHNIVRDALKKDEYAEGEIKTYDGMDVAVCVYSNDTNTVEYAGANRPLLYIEDGEVLEMKPDKISINSPSHPNATFTNNIIQITKRTCFYMFSDGITDQFGGEKGKKFLTKQVKDIILENYNQSLANQFLVFEKRVNDWKTGYQQIDDQLLIGFAVDKK